MSISIGQGACLVAVGALAAGINAIAGGGSLISFPYISVGIGLAEKIANATNSVGLWPGSLAGGLGARNLLEKTKPYLRQLIVPTCLGSICGAWLLLTTTDLVFRRVIPGLILLAAILLLLQPKVKALMGKHMHILPSWLAILLQFLVATYGGYFGAGMGIMMLACFALYMDGTVHELNAIKNWMGLIINFTCSFIFITKGLVEVVPAVLLTVGALIGGFSAAHFSQRLDPDRLRLAIAIYGILMASYFGYRAYY